MTKVQTVIRRLRETMSQSEIARRTGLSQSKLSRWEAGRVAAGAEEALKLAALAAEIDAKPTAAPPHQHGEGA